MGLAMAHDWRHWQNGEHTVLTRACSLSFRPCLDSSDLLVVAFLDPCMGAATQADILCCYKTKEKKKLLNAMKLHIATDIRCATEPEEQEEGLFIITVR